MVLFFYVAINAAVLVFFFQKKKRQPLHIIEIWLYWIIASYLFQNFSAICYMNFKTILIPNQLRYELSHLLNRTILYPGLMVMFLYILQLLGSRLRQLIIMLGFVLLLTGLEWLSDVLGVFIHSHWHIWWSLLFWQAALVALIVFMKFFRRMLYKGDYRL